MSRNIISTFTAAVMSMSIAMAVPVAVTAVSSLTVVPQAQALGWKKIKRVVKRQAKHTTDKIRGKRCPGGSWINGRGICGKAVSPKIFVGRIGDPVNNHDHRKK